MSIWFRDYTIDELQQIASGSMPDHLDIRITEIGDDHLRGTMPVEARTRQPFGILHGGASVVLAETLGSFASHMVVDDKRYYAVGQQISASHVRPVSDGLVTGTATPLHLGRRSHVWDIRIEDERGRLISISRLTMAVVDRT